MISQLAQQFDFYSSIRDSISLANRYRRNFPAALNPGAIDEILTAQNLSRIFGQKNERAAEMLRQGRGRNEIFEQTGSMVAVDNVSLGVRAGEIFVIMGLSGSGKSTRVRLLSRLIEPTSGKVVLEGRDIAPMSTPNCVKCGVERWQWYFSPFAPGGNAKIAALARNTPMSFASLGLIDPLLRTLQDLNYQTPTPVQAEAIPAVLSGRDVMAAAQTGTGKTAGFALPLLQRLVQHGPAVSSNRARVLVLAPTRELAEQVLQSFIDYGKGLGLRFLAAYGGVSINPQMMTLRKGVDVLVATPGRLLDLNRQNAVQLDQVQTLVLDEADRMLDLGFSRELNAVFAALPTQRQTLLFSATFTDDIRAMAAAILRSPVNISVGSPNATASKIKQWVVTVDKKNKPDLFMHLVAQNNWEHALVFVKTRIGVDYLAAMLDEAGYSVDTIHGDKPQPARLRALERFKRGEVHMLVATDVASRGLDIDDLPLVINVDLPIVAQDYVHRIGRTGRAGASGVAVSLVCADEAPQLAAIEALIRQTLPREEEPGFEAEHRVPQTSATGQIIKKPKKPKKPKVPGAVQVPSNKPRPQSGESKRKPAVQRAAAEDKGSSFASGSPFNVQKPRSRPTSKPVADSRKPAGKPAGGSGKR